MVRRMPTGSRWFQSESPLGLRALGALGLRALGALGLRALGALGLRALGGGEALDRPV